MFGKDCVLEIKCVFWNGLLVRIVIVIDIVIVDFIGTTFEFESEKVILTV